jgi:NADPH2:quinone reductase
MPFAIRMHQTGGPEVMCWEELEVGDPAPGEARVRHQAVGLNYIDIYHRSGLYPLQLPNGLGLEAAGCVEAVGAGVSELHPGDRVAYAGGPVGAYSQVRCLPADRLLKLPENIDFRIAAAMMLQGLTSAYLLRRTYRVQAGDSVLIHAAAGGVGLIACQWAKALGATVIGTVSGAAKAALALAHGCDHVIDYSREDFPRRVREITAGEGVAVVYDGVGKDTFGGSLDSLRTCGMMVSFGNASGPVPPFDPLLLSQKGSLFLTRPTLMHYTAKRADLVALGAELFEVVGSGKVRIEVNQTYPLAEVASRASRPGSTQAYRIDHPVALMKRLQARLVALRYLLATAWPIVLITAIGLAVAYQFVEPEPPRRISISTGSETGAYYAYAQRYANTAGRQRHHAGDQDLGRFAPEPGAHRKWRGRCGLRAGGHCPAGDRR